MDSICKCFRSEVYGRSDGYAEPCTAVSAELLQSGRKRREGETRTVRVYVSAVLFLFLNVKMVMFFLCTAEHYSIINPVLLHKFKGYNKENDKPDESLGRKARRG